jgi:hypothetical protein
MVGKRPEVPHEIVARLRAVCLALPESREEAAWVGTRWCVGKKTFAHVVMIADGWPPAYAKAAGSNGPLCVLTFQSLAPRVDPHTFSRPPYFRPPWRPDIVGQMIDACTDWDDVGQLLAASYCMLAPRKLADQVRQARGAADAPPRKSPRLARS